MPPPSTNVSLFREHRALSAAAAAIVTGLALHQVLPAVREHLAGADTTAAPLSASKPCSESSFAASWPVTPDMCDNTGRLYGGELLKLIDVMAGVASRKHSGCHTVTVSVDRVIFLKECKVGDIVHLSVSVNRSWATSLETGVRCMREDGETGKKSYACHAYLTFVALPPKVAPSYLPTLMQPKRPKLHLPAIVPGNLLEKKRFLLAGRRRGHRIQRAPAHSAILAAFRTYIFSIPLTRSSAAIDAAQEEQIMALQRDLIVEAYLHKDPDVRLDADGKTLIAEMDGFMEAIRVPLGEVERAAKAKGHGAFRALQPPKMLSPLNSSSFEDISKAASPLDLEDTLAVSMWIVRPQHTNSANNLFGGQLLLWLEQVSFMAGRKLAHVVSTATIDSMTFKESVKQGEIVFVRAVVLHVWESSIEVYAVATGESPTTPTRFVADAFLTLIAIDPSTGRPLRGKLRHLNIPPGPGQQLAASADQRRAERLEDKRTLVAMYGDARS